jgi:4-amino-4-deoxy-L-arabinose transferase-like glycosyltransferase
MDQKPQTILRIQRQVFWAVLAALGIRLLVVAFVYPNVLTLRRDHWAFGCEVGRIARSIYDGQGFSSPLYHPTGPTAWMTPAYPYMVAGIFKVFGLYTKSAAWAALTLNALFSALTCVPIFYLARRSFGEKVAMWAAWAWAVFPYAIYLSANFVWYTALTTLLLATLLAMTFRLERGAGFGMWMLYGLIWGLAALTNATVLTLLPIFGIWACIRLHRQGEKWFLRAAAAAAVFWVTLSPWEIRNYRTFHQVILARDNFGLELWVGNNGDTTFWDIDAAHPSENPAELEEYERMGELAYMAKKRSQAMTFITSHPGTYALLVLRRFVYTWTGYWSFARDYLAVESMDPWNMVLSIPVTVLMILGLRRAFKEEKDTAVLYLLIVVVFPLIFYLTHPGIRFRHTIDPVIVSLACYAAVPLPRLSREPAAAVVGLAGSQPELR